MVDVTFGLGKLDIDIKATGTNVKDNGGEMSLV